MLGVPWKTAGDLAFARRFVTAFIPLRRRARTRRTGYLISSRT